MTRVVDHSGSGKDGAEIKFPCGHDLADTLQESVENEVGVYINPDAKEVSLDLASFDIERNELTIHASMSPEQASNLGCKGADGVKTALLGDSGAVNHSRGATRVGSTLAYREGYERVFKN